MNTLTPIEQFRDGLERGAFTMSEIARLADIPVSTLQRMKEDAYGNRIRKQHELLSKLDAAIKQANTSGSSRSKDGAAA